MRMLAAIFLLLMFGCTDAPVDKPDKLIDEDVMVDIFYDLSILDAMRTQKPLSLREHDIDPDKYIYEKYKIDSLQFAQSNRYYASQMETYKKMYERVKTRLQNKTAELDPTKPKPVTTKKGKEAVIK